MSTYEISKSSLLSLKAEILKKQEEVNKAKIENKVKLEKVRKGPLELKNKGVESRAQNDLSEEDQDLLKKSRSVLEAKAELYEKLTKNSKSLDREKVRQYLVKFDEKQQNFDDDIDRYKEESDEETFNEKDYAAENSDDEWVEYVDSFGRTRTCLKKDLRNFKEKDKEIEKISRSIPNTEEKTEKKPESDEEIDDDSEKVENLDENAEMLSADMRKELLRQQWEKEEEELRDKSDIHYQDILFNEARTHGVGYYGFSKDEEVRAKQQEALKNLRKETEEKQKLAQELRQNREKLLAGRIRAAKNRKRAREGLPPLTSDDEIETTPKKEEPVIEEEKPVEKSKEEKRKELKRKTHVRPWDIGKEGSDDTKRNRDPYSQDEWNEIQRKKRVQEFAPPKNYRDNDFSTKSADKKFIKHSQNINPYKSQQFKPTPIQNECSSSEESEDELLRDYKRTEIPPPATYEYYGPSGQSQRSKNPKNNMEDAIMQGLKYLRKKVEKKT